MNFTPQQWLAFGLIGVGIAGAAIQHGGTLVTWIKSKLPTFAAPAAAVADDDTLDFQALRRLQKRFGAKPEVLTALKTVASAFIEGPTA